MATTVPWQGYPLAAQPLAQAPQTFPPALPSVEPEGDYYARPTGYEEQYALYPYRPPSASAASGAPPPTNTPPFAANLLHPSLPTAPPAQAGSHGSTSNDLLPAVPARPYPRSQDTSAPSQSSQADPLEPAPQPARRGRPPKPGSRGSKRRARLAAQAAQEAAAAAARAEKERAAALAVQALEALDPLLPAESTADPDGSFPTLPEIDLGCAVGEVLGQLAHTAQSAARFLHLNAPSEGEVSAAKASQEAEETLILELAPKSKPGRKPLNDVPCTKRTAQNRASQRAFRERKQAHLRSLEAKVERYEQERTQMAETLTFLATTVAKQQPRCAALERELAQLKEKYVQLDRPERSGRPERPERTERTDPPQPSPRPAGWEPPGPRYEARGDIWAASSQRTDRELPPLCGAPGGGTLSLPGLASLPSLMGLSDWGRRSRPGSHPSSRPPSRPTSQGRLPSPRGWYGEYNDDLPLLDGPASEDRQRDRPVPGGAPAGSQRSESDYRSLPLLPLRRRRTSSSHTGKKPKLWTVSERRPMLGAWGSAPTAHRPGAQSARTSSTGGPGPAGGPAGPISGAASSAGGSVVSGGSAASAWSGSGSRPSIRLGSVEPGWKE